MAAILNVEWRVWLPHMILKVDKQVISAEVSEQNICSQNMHNWLKKNFTEPPRIYVEILMTMYM
jgi:hypothetical protein